MPRLNKVNSCYAPFLEEKVLVTVAAEFCRQFKCLFGSVNLVILCFYELF